MLKLLSTFALLLLLTVRGLTAAPATDCWPPSAEISLASAVFLYFTDVNGVQRAVITATIDDQFWKGPGKDLPLVDPMQAQNWCLIACDNQGKPKLGTDGRPVLMVHPDSVERYSFPDPVSGGLDTTDRIILVPGRALTSFKPGDYFLTLAKASVSMPTPTNPKGRTDQFVELNFQEQADRITARTDQSSYSYTAAPVYQQSLDNGVKRNVIQFPLTYSQPVLIPNQRLGRFFFKSDNRLSTEYNDSATKLGVAVGYARDVPRFGDISHPLSLSGDLHYQSNQSFRNQDIGTAFSLATSLGPFTSANIAPYLVLSPLQFERRYKIDTAQTPQHTQHDLYDPEAQLIFTRYLQPLRSDTTAYTTDNLTLTLTGWYFPNEQALGGYSVRRTEGRIDLLYRHTVRWGIFQAVDFTYSDGANSANGFARSRTVGIGLTAFSKDFSLFSF